MQFLTCDLFPLTVLAQALASHPARRSTPFGVTSISEAFELVSGPAWLHCHSRRDALVHNPLPGVKLQVLKLSLLSREFSGVGVRADPHMSCKLY